MNLHVKPAVQSPRPEAPARRRWTADDLERMVRAEIIDENEPVELIDGEIIAMAAKGRRHEIVRNVLAFRWTRMCPDGVMLAEEPAFRLSDTQEPEPDIILFPSSLFIPDVRGDTALLVVEVADTSLSYDLTIKAPIYAAHGVREYWVIDARNLATHVHRGPTAEGYASVEEISGTSLIQPMLVPTLALRLADLGIEA